MASVFYIEEIGLVIFTLFSHRKLETVSGYSVILLNNYGLIMQEKWLFC